jgi:hypothetical protein
LKVGKLKVGKLISCTILNKSKNLTPQPPSLVGKGEPELLLPSPVRGGVGGGVKPIIATGARCQKVESWKVEV